jgi:hypothetical protein
MLVRLLFGVYLLLVSYVHTFGQERAKFLSLETGVDFIDSQTTEQKDFIRAESPDFYGTDAYSRKIIYQLHKTFAGVRIEMRNQNDRFGFSTGLRFTQVNSSITKNSAPHYFYFLLRQTGTTTEYLRIRKLNQTSGYLSIPFEVRFFPYDQKMFRLFIVLGCDINYRLMTKTEADFTDPAMSIYQSDVSKISGDPSVFHSSFYARAGFLLGKNKPRIGIGVTAPVIITDNSSSLVYPTVGGGFFLQVQFPL